MNTWDVTFEAVEPKTGGIIRFSITVEARTVLTAIKAAQRLTKSMGGIELDRLRNLTVHIR